MAEHHPSQPIGSVLQPPPPIAPSIAAAAAAEQALQVQLLSDKATAPSKGSTFAAGHDLYSARDITIPARGRAIVATDISIAVPAGTCTSFLASQHLACSPSHLPSHLFSHPTPTDPLPTDGRVAPRSGLAAKHGIDTMAGVIDADYRGPVGVILANLSDDDFSIKTGDRIAQLIVEKICMPEVVVVQKLEESVRGAGGFGSTGGFGAVEGVTGAVVNGV